MKKMLAIILVCVTLVSSTVCAFAAEDNDEAVLSRDWRDLAERYAEEMTRNADLQRQINDLNKKLNAAIEVNKAYERKADKYNGSRTDPKPQRSSEAREEALKRNNAVSSGGTTAAQGGHVEINGNKSSVTFVVNPPSGSVATSANNLAARISGTLLCCLVTSSPGVNFKTAKANFYVSGVTDNDTIAVYQLQGKEWVQLPAVCYKDHVIVDMKQHGPLSFIRTPNVAMATN